MTLTRQKDYFWNTIGVFLQNAISPLLLVVITRINGIEDSGLFSFAFSLAILFWAISMWGGRTYQVSDVKREFSTHSYIYVRIILGAFVLIASVLFCLLNGYDSDKFALIVSLVVIKILESFSDALYGIMQIHKKLYVAGKSLVYKAILSIAVFLLVDVQTGSILLGSIGMIIANAVILVLYDIRKVNIQEKISIEKIFKSKAILSESTELIKRCAPVFGMTLLAMLSLNIPRYFLDVYHAVEIGIFGIIAMPVTLIVLVVSFILQPNVLRLATLLKDKKIKEFSHIVTKLIAATSLIGIFILGVTLLIGVEVLGFVFSIDFQAYKHTLLIIVLGAIVNALLAIILNILVIMRRFRAQFLVLLVSNIALIPVANFAVDRYGIDGAVTLFVGVNVVQFFMLFVTYIVVKGRFSDEKEA